MSTTAPSSTDARGACCAPSQIAVSPAAGAAIAELAAAHGELMFHVTGGCCDARTPLCLRAGDLSLGPRDVLIGHANGVPIYEMASGQDDCCGATYRLDVVDGVPVGFSLPPGHMTRFALRQTAG